MATENNLQYNVYYFPKEEKYIERLIKLGKREKDFAITDNLFIYCDAMYFMYLQLCKAHWSMCGFNCAIQIK